VLEQRPHQRGAGVVDEDVDRAEGVQRRLDERDDALLVRDVGLHRDCVRAVTPLDVERHLRDQLRSPCGDDEPRAGLRQTVCELRSEPGRSAGDDRDTTVEAVGAH
jgi:hypothetical protein